MAVGVGRPEHRRRRRGRAAGGGHHADHLPDQLRQPGPDRPAGLPGPQQPPVRDGLRGERPQPALGVGRPEHRRRRRGRAAGGGHHADHLPDRLRQPGPDRPAGLPGPQQPPVRDGLRGERPQPALGVGRPEHRRRRRGRAAGGGHHADHLPDRLRQPGPDRPAGLPGHRATTCTRWPTWGTTPTRTGGGPT